MPPLSPEELPFPVDSALAHSHWDKNSSRLSWKPMKTSTCGLSASDSVQEKDILCAVSVEHEATGRGPLVPLVGHGPLAEPFPPTPTQENSQIVYFPVDSAQKRSGAGRSFPRATPCGKQHSLGSVCPNGELRVQRCPGIGQRTERRWKSCPEQVT